MKTKKNIVILFLLILQLCACSNTPDGITANGETINLRNYQGKWVVINYWAKWCKPCLTELPELNQMYNAYKKQVMVLGVSFDELSSQEIQQFAQKFNINFPMLVSFNQKKLDIEHIGGLPVTYIISPQGKLVKILHGPQTQTSLITLLKLKASRTVK